MAPNLERHPAPPLRSWPVRYGVALLLTAAGIGVTIGWASLTRTPFLTFQLAAIVAVALHGGFGPALLSTLISTAVFAALYLGPSLDLHEAIRVGAFVAVSLLVAWIAALSRRARDEAERARARAQAAEQEARAIGAQQERLVSVVSHDLRSPLGAIGLSAETIRAGGVASETQARALARIVSSVGRMQAMIGDLLDYARARHASGLPVHPRPARLGEIARRVTEEARAANPGAAIELEVVGDDTASLDPARVEQVVSNLLSNALKHASAGAPVRVRIAGEPGAVRLEVSNRGAPIPPQLVPTLFDPFRPGDAPGSVGLGLFIVREIARGHGGMALASSDERGTTFTVTFPTNVPAAPAA